MRLSNSHMGVAAMDEFRLSKLQDDVRRPLSRKSHGGSATGFHSLSDKSAARQIQMREGGKGYSEEAEEDAFFDLDIIFKDRKASRRQNEATRDAMKPRRLEGRSHREVDTCHLKPSGESKESARSLTFRQSVDRDAMRMVCQCTNHLKILAICHTGKSTKEWEY